jgi:hypothetical protein
VNKVKLEPQTGAIKYIKQTKVSELVSKVGATVAFWLDGDFCKQGWDTEITKFKIVKTLGHKWIEMTN